MAYELRCIQYTNSCERGNSYDVSHGGGRLSYICRKLLMEAAVLTLHQVILMMLLIAVGIACARLKWFSDEVAQALSRFLLWFVTPALLIDAFSRDYNAAEAHNLLLSGLLGIVFHLLAAGIAKLAIRCGDKGKCAVARMSAMYSNCGFMTFPLISAVLGEIGVFYGSAFVGMFNLSLWTQGRALLLGRKGITMRGALCNAGVLGTIAGCMLYFCRFPLPGIAGSLAASLASLNTPLAMIVIGVFLSRCSLRSLLCREVLWPSLLRTAVIPLCYFAVALHTACLAMGERGWLRWDCCHALCILPVRCEQRAHDRISGYGLGLRLTYYFHDKHFICFYDPNACASDQFNLTVIDKMLAGMYTVCIDKLRQVKQHGTEKLKKGSISDG